MRLLALGGIAGTVLFSVVVVVSAAFRENYSHVSSFISELGATGTANAGFMNYAGFVPAGLLLAAFGIGLARLLPRHYLAIIAAGLVTVFGLGVTASGIASCDPGCPEPGGSMENIIHNLIAPPIFLGLIVGIGLFGVYCRRLPDWRAYSAYSLVSSVAALFLMAALASSVEARELSGLWQRLFLAVVFLWCAVISLHAYRLAAIREH